MKVYKLLAAAVLAILINGCGSSNHYAANKGNEEPYIAVIDYDKVLAVERATKNSTLNIKSYWVNYPTKKVTKSEYISSKK